jgi:hypothetical protein
MPALKQQHAGIANLFLELEPSSASGGRVIAEKNSAGKVARLVDRS